MAPLWHFNLDKPIKEYSFEQLLEAFKDVIDYAIVHVKPQHYKMSPDDLQQEMAIILWKCHQRYKHLPNAEFYKIFRKSVGHRVMDFVRNSFRPSQRAMLTLEEAGPVADSGHMLPIDFYDRNIKTICETIDPEGRVMLNSVLHNGSNSIRGRRKREIVNKVKDMICQ